ncbi:Hypothetical predicted protein [Paramuricea clavata]|uniref:Uncharacterized protein n=1 Tax=Paramuricea clavata TaxID=317549 RepID=A0A6S7K658_PARCT|nr:Hypothetical predicted protein [Paramuricea clavata]
MHNLFPFSRFCPSIFIFTTAEIPCFGLLRLKLGSCLRMSNGTSHGGIRCSPNIGNQIESLALNTLFTDDEKVVSTLDQTFLLLLVIGRWLLPKGQMSREQLSQLLLIYIAAAADIVELTEIYEVQDVMSNSSMINLLISIWSISLLQFSVTIQNAESVAQDKANEEIKMEKDREANGESSIKITTEKKSNRVAPALYTYKLAQRKAFEKQQERRNTMDLDALRPVTHNETDQPQNNSNDKKGSFLSRALKTLKQFESTVQNFIHTHIDLIQLLTPMVLQDGPFLILRLFVASKYDITESNMFVFLIAKNALVVMLQVYRICVLYCKPSEHEGTEDDIFNEIGTVKLRNVQTAHASVRTATLTVQAVSKFKKKRATKRKMSRTFSLTLSNPFAGFRRKTNESMDSSKAGSSKQESDDRADSIEHDNMHTI